MTKATLIDKIAKENGLTKKNVTEVYEALEAAVKDALAAGEAVQLFGFGTFAVKQQAARTARNPRTNEAIEIPACRKVSFSASKALKDKVNEA